MGVAQLLVATEHINQKDGLLIAGLATIALGIVTNKKPSIPRDFSHLGVSTYQSVDTEMAEAINQQPSNRRIRNLTRSVDEHPEPIEVGDRTDPIYEQRTDPINERRRSTGMGDRVSPLDREESPRNPDDGEY